MSSASSTFHHCRPCSTVLAATLSTHRHFRFLFISLAVPVAVLNVASGIAAETEATRRDGIARPAISDQSAACEAADGSMAFLTFGTMPPLSA